VRERQTAEGGKAGPGAGERGTYAGSLIRLAEITSPQFRAQGYGGRVTGDGTTGWRENGGRSRAVEGAGVEEGQDHPILAGLFVHCGGVMAILPHRFDGMLRTHANSVHLGTIDRLPEDAQ